MSTPDSAETPQTWDDGRLGADDVIEAADGTGYESLDDFGAGESGFDPDVI